MNKLELVDHVAKYIGITKGDAEKAVRATLDGIITAMAGDGVLQIVGFGSFKKQHRAARVGRNPKTGDAVKIAAKNVVKFKVGTVFDEAVNAPKTRTKKKK